MATDRTSILHQTYVDAHELRLKLQELCRQLTYTADLEAGDNERLAATLMVEVATDEQALMLQAAQGALYEVERKAMALLTAPGAH